MSPDANQGSTLPAASPTSEKFHNHNTVDALRFIREEIDAMNAPERIDKIRYLLHWEKLHYYALGHLLLAEKIKSWENDEKRFKRWVCDELMLSWPQAQRLISAVEAMDAAHLRHADVVDLNFGKIETIKPILQTENQEKIGDILKAARLQPISKLRKIVNAKLRRGANQRGANPHPALAELADQIAEMLPEGVACAGVLESAEGFHVAELGMTRVRAKVLLDRGAPRMVNGLEVAGIFTRSEEAN